ncbi:hypothetical protein DM01DRAFT_1386693 [Hesseltinella vesiculosa]|uniref:Uncharacterized protein n=1 Tax=Hesseltinella vesiculosa TaxID=101127 RepID=A0A1X2G4X5_9FUNG|nr:hypothetical protein DM01DRAFT_1386693 [Hesseltinella vesiculosa]
MSEQVVDLLQDLANERQEYELEIQRENVARAKEELRKRRQNILRSADVANSANKKQKVIIPEDPKAQYNYILEHNQIKDSTCSSSRSGYVSYQPNDLDLDWLPEELNSVYSTKDALKCLSMVERHSVKSLADRSIKNIVRHILEYHAFPQLSISDARLQKLSEMTVIVQFWSYLFDQYFRCNTSILIQWGDTVPKACLDLDITLKMDLRVIVDADDEMLDLGNAEVASVRTSTFRKCLKDKLKCCIAAKCCLNFILSKYNIPAKTIPKIVIPLIHVMGLHVRVYGFHMAAKSKYDLFNLCDFSFPRRFNDISEGKIQHIFWGLESIDNTVQRTVDIIKSAGRSTKSPFTTTPSRQKTPPIWTTSVYWPFKKEECDNDDLHTDTPEEDIGSEQELEDSEQELA